ncbi:MAG: M13-type metalloendopeptidase [Candidatus Acidiferrales bacterium]
MTDLGGTILAQVARKDAAKDMILPDRDGLTPDQRFFVGFAPWACENNRPENQRVNAITDPHSPGEYRMNGVVVNMPEFGAAFSRQAGQPMESYGEAPERVCQVW